MGSGRRFTIHAKSEYLKNAKESCRGCRCTTHSMSRNETGVARLRKCLAIVKIRYSGILKARSFLRHLQRSEKTIVICFYFYRVFGDDNCVFGYLP